MSDGIYTALSGAVAQQRALDTVANNVANVATPGFRGDALAFREFVSTAQAADPTLPNGLRYVAVDASRTSSIDGPLMQTGNPLDLALQGDGMLAVETPNGVRYTRAASLVMDGDGRVMTHAGHPVLTSSGPLEVQPNTQTLNFAPDGTVNVDGNAVGQLRIERFPPDGLVKEGLTLFAPAPGATGEPATEVSVAQGFLEGANVSPIGGMNELVVANRSYDAFQKVIQAFRHIDERTARDVASR
jgi:flagellar basal-body rod protein FlgF